MNRKVVAVEPDANARGLLDRVLTSAGYTVETFTAAQDARVLLDEDAFDVAVVDELDASGGFLDGVRFLRARYPRLPLVVTGAMLSSDALVELLRSGVRDALPKPYNPTELRDAVARALAHGARDHAASLDYAAALGVALDALAAGRVAEARPALARARALSPLDAEVTALDARCAELEGRDDDAARGYLAAMALQRGEDDAAISPREGLARVSAGRGRR